MGDLGHRVLRRLGWPDSDVPLLAVKYECPATCGAWRTGTKSVPASRRVRRIALFILLINDNKKYHTHEIYYDDDDFVALHHDLYEYIFIILFIKNTIIIINVF